MVNISGEAHWKDHGWPVDVRSRIECLICITVFRVVVLSVSDM